MKCSELVGPGELYPRRGPVWPVACVRAPAPATLHYSSDSSNVSLLASVAAMRAARSRRCTVNRRYLPAAFRYGRGSAATAPAWRENRHAVALVTDARNVAHKIVDLRKRLVERPQLGAHSRLPCKLGSSTGFDAGALERNRAIRYFANVLGRRIERAQLGGLQP